MGGPISAPSRTVSCHQNRRHLPLLSYVNTIQSFSSRAALSRSMLHCDLGVPATCQRHKQHHHDHSPSDAVARLGRCGTDGLHSWPCGSPSSSLHHHVGKDWVRGGVLLSNACHIWVEKEATGCETYQPRPQATLSPSLQFHSDLSPPHTVLRLLEHGVTPVTL